MAVVIAGEAGDLLEQTQEQTGELLEQGSNVARDWLELLAQGDVRTWLAFLAVAVVLVLLVGLWRGSIRIGRGG